MEDVEKHHSCIMTYSNLPPWSVLTIQTALTPTGRGKYGKQLEFMIKRFVSWKQKVLYKNLSSFLCLDKLLSNPHTMKKFICPLLTWTYRRRTFYSLNFHSVPIHISPTRLDVARVIAVPLASSITFFITWSPSRPSGPSIRCS